jgi:hypothetical protein
MSIIDVFASGVYLTIIIFIIFYLKGRKTLAWVI